MTLSIMALSIMPLSMMTLSIMPLSIMTLTFKYGLNKLEKGFMTPNITTFCITTLSLRVTILNGIMLSVFC
jgi:hypothetical protein